MMISGSSVVAVDHYYPVLPLPMISIVYWLTIEVYKQERSHMFEYRTTRFKELLSSTNDS